MRRFNRFAALALAASLSLTACGDGDDDSAGGDACAPGDENPKVGIAYDGSGRGDKSFNDAAFAAIEKAETDFGITYKEATPSGGSDDDTAREDRLRTLAESGMCVIVGNGYAYSVAAAAVAPDYPEINFAVIDGFSTTLSDAPPENLADLTFAEEQGSYLVGVAAGLKTKSDHVGFVGGNTGPLITKFAAGFQAGVESANPDAKVDIKFLTEDPNDINTSFFNPSGAKTAAEGMIDAGADVIFQAAGQSGLGAIDAVVAAGKGHWAIGVDSDQYNTVSPKQQPFILTSMLKRVDTAIYEFIKAYVDGEPPTGFAVYDIKVDGVGYSTSGDFVTDIVPQLDEAAEALKSGEVTAPTTLD